ncbi:hypothetical protein HYFRA_00012744 [Hymenoscyphus fraxineus]|uniref:Succinate dehydrogenase cytochrome b560 subunit n=1 Tax=Hymenoscyphus fraxineus TaxID=746836 RepID=A0A9N9L815_9HELO|nr:hypothetical protein HYFRA_00012744 [Hymenoscyphus fraxineus]
MPREFFATKAWRGRLVPPLIDDDDLCDESITNVIVSSPSTSAKGRYTEFLLCYATQDAISTMLAQRTIQQSLRRVAAGGYGSSQQLALSKIAIAPLSISKIQNRHAATSPGLTPADSYKILVEQRKNRPVSPHLAIYQPQIPWILSITHRITGSILSGGFYIFGSAYLVAPVLGWDLSSAAMAASFGAWPLLAKVSAKFLVALPFTFHSFNGIRHLAWDSAVGFGKLTVIKTGWACVGVSLVSALGLAFFV